jgi:polyphosphate kinase 2 (PPK2 family)
MKYRKQIKESARLAEPYCVRKGEKFRLRDYHTGGTGEVKNKEHSLRIIENRAGLLSNLQEKLYAQDRWALLLVIQAMDAAGKDGVIKHVMSGVNPQGCEVHAFKTPSAEELNHDYLWRAHRCVPERGKIGILRRSSGCSSSPHPLASAKTARPTGYQAYLGAAL